MKSILSYSLLAAAMAAGVATAQPTTATTTPVGYTSINCPPNSDTIVGLPLRKSAEGAGALSAAPSVAGSSATLNISSPSFVASAFAGTHYVKFKNGSAAGKWFAVTANSTTSLTIDLNGETLAAASGDLFEVLKFWTLGELLPAATTTSDAATTGTAIVASTSALPAGRRTEILIPDTTAAGINLAPNATFYIFNGGWRKQGVAATDLFDSFQLWPDTYFIIRHRATVTAATKYVVSGEVETSSFAIPLSTQAAVKQDNFVAIPRPIDVTLNGLNLGGTSAFTSSLSGLPAGRRDEVYVYDNVATAINKAASATYYYLNGAWRKQGSAADLDVGTSVIPAGSGLLIRKYQTPGAVTSIWNNTATY